MLPDGQSVDTQWSTTGDGNQSSQAAGIVDDASNSTDLSLRAVDWNERSHSLEPSGSEFCDVTYTPGTVITSAPVARILANVKSFPRTYNIPEHDRYLLAKSRQKKSTDDIASIAPGRSFENSLMSETVPPVDKDSEELDRTAATSPELRQSAATPADLPPPAVTGRGIRTGESIDPGAAKEVAAGLVEAPAAAPVDELLGTTYVGKYELVSIIGSGGMGVIYQGRQIFLDRIVAIKMLKSNLAGVKARMRFHQEAKAASQLNHPGIVAINDFGVDELDRPYMVMEHVEGCTFSDLLRERSTLSVEDSLPVFLEICDALSEAHHKGIVHRDLKPSNIMLVVGVDGKVHIKLLDFGIAKMLDIQDHTLQSLTKTGEALGTPLYMSPEQIQGDKITYKSDLYSLGCMMYTCLTGTPPFVGDNKLRTMEKHCTAQPLPLKLASKGRDFAPGIEPIVMRLLEKSPQDRFDSVDQLKDALIEMAVQNRFMRRPQAQQAAAGQLYLTGAIPEMPKSIADMVPRGQTTQAFDALYEGTQGQKTSADSLGLTAFTSTGASKSNDTGPKTGSLKREPVRRDQRKESPYPEPEQTARDYYFGSGRAARSRNPARNWIVISAGIVGILLIFVVAGWTSLRFAPIPAKTLVPTHEQAQIKARSAVNISAPPSPQMESADSEIHRKFNAGAMDRSMSFRNRHGLTEKGLKELATFKFLRILDLSGTKMNGAWVQHLANSNLKLLNLDNNPGVSDWSLYYLTQMRSLTHLSLARTGITNSGLSYLSRSSSIAYLCLDRNRQITEQGIKRLAPETSRLGGLYLEHCNVSDVAANDFTSFKHLIALDLADNPGISDHTLQVLQPKSNELVFLIVAEDRIGDAGIHAVSSFKGLKTLDLVDIKLSPKAQEDLGKMKGLTTIFVNGCGLTPAEIARLGDQLPSTTIEEHQACSPDFTQL